MDDQPETLQPGDIVFSSGRTGLATGADLSELLSRGPSRARHLHYRKQDRKWLAHVAIVADAGNIFDTSLDGGAKFTPANDWLKTTGGSAIVYRHPNADEFVHSSIFAECFKYWGAVYDIPMILRVVTNYTGPADPRFICTHLVFEVACEVGLLERSSSPLSHSRFIYPQELRRELDRLDWRQLGHFIAVELPSLEASAELEINYEATRARGSKTLQQITGFWTGPRKERPTLVEMLAIRAAHQVDPITYLTDMVDEIASIRTAYSSQVAENWLVDRYETRVEDNLSRAERNKVLAFTQYRDLVKSAIEEWDYDPFTEKPELREKSRLDDFLFETQNAIFQYWLNIVAGFDISMDEYSEFATRQRTAINLKIE